jgi:hypothetical protein
MAIGVCEWLGMAIASFVWSRGQRFNSKRDYIQTRVEFMELKWPRKYTEK